LRRPPEASTSQILEDAPHRVGVERFAALRVLVPDVGQGDVCDSIVQDKARAHEAQESAESDVGTLGNLEIRIKIASNLCVPRASKRTL
jgi:hypothetical protein